MPAPIVAALALPFLKDLAESGLGLIAGAIKAKGKEVVEKELGVKIPEGGLTEEKKQELAIKQMEHEEFLIDAQVQQAQIELEAEKAAGQQVTERWKADMSSDSWLSKNVRPLTLIYWTVVISVFIVLDSTIKAFNVKQMWVDLITYSYVTILGAYFLGRTAQHVTNMLGKNKKK